MDIVRIKGTGSFDKRTKTWRLRAECVSVTVGRLQAIYGTTFTAETPADLKRQTAPYWRRYLQDREDDAHDRQRAEEQAARFAPTAQRLEALILRLEGQNPANAIVERLRATTAADLEGIDFGPLGSVESFALPPAKQAPQVTIASEAHHTLAALEREKGRNGAFCQAKQALDLLCDVCGPLEPHAVTVDHWRCFFQKVTTRKGWGTLTQRNIVGHARLFLKTVAQERNANYGFLDSKKFTIVRGDGQKVKYTAEQVRTALDNATGFVRVQLLMGLNCGMYAGDLLELTADKIQGGYVVWQRAKLGKNAPTLKHRLWKATRQALEGYDFKASKFKIAGYTAFARKHALPHHKALRKTVAQRLQDAAGDSVSRHYRGELAGGTHMTNYVEKRLGDKEQATLDAALEAIGHDLDCQ